MATHEEWAEVLHRAWEDEDFKNLLEHDPAAAFRECGIKPERIIQVFPHPDDMSDEQLEVIQPNEEGRPLFFPNAKNSKCAGQIIFPSNNVEDHVKVHFEN